MAHAELWRISPSIPRLSDRPIAYKPFKRVLTPLRTRSPSSSYVGYQSKRSDSCGQLSFIPAVMSEVADIRPYPGEYFHGVDLANFYPCWNLSLSSQLISSEFVSSIDANLGSYGMSVRDCSAREFEGWASGTRICHSTRHDVRRVSCCYPQWRSSRFWSGKYALDVEGRNGQDIAIKRCRDRV